LTGLYVLSAEQGSRIGTALLEVAVAHGARELWVYAEHPGARAFYERHGWVPDGEPEVIGEDWAISAPALRYVLP
jgi:GNAT superfamily N-acetyltransferase